MATAQTLNDREKMDDRTISDKPYLLSFAKAKEKQRHPQSQRNVASHLLLPQRTPQTLTIRYE
jgi:hypothetical protein